MIVPDVNLLLYATITAYPQHQRSRAWWEQAINGDDEVGLTSPAVFGFIRIATNARMLESPMSVAQAIEHVTDWLSQPNVSFLPPGEDHLDIAFGLLRSLGTGGNLTTDVQLAAYAIERGAELYSNDRDFGRFPGLRWSSPLA